MTLQDFKNQIAEIVAEALADGLTPAGLLQAALEEEARTLDGDDL